MQSGIRDSRGGFARYYRSDSQQNLPVSNEITGYAVSALLYLHRSLPPGELRESCLHAALETARYLTREAWDAGSATFPFEPSSPKVYFFDTGIIARGLLAAWKQTGDREFYSRARDASLSMAFDFLGDGEIYPVISLPDKQPLSYEASWSREPGCYQTKSALAWLGVGEESGRRMFDTVLASALATHEAFLDAVPEPEKLMDRLHPYCYFLEALLAVADRADCRAALASGIDRVGTLLRRISPQFERSDVGAQLLRVRLIAHHLNVIQLNEEAACDEADRAASFQFHGDDPRSLGGFGFGLKRGAMMPFVNPVSAVFCLQALNLWHQHRAGEWDFEFWQLI